MTFILIVFTISDILKVNKVIDKNKQTIKVN